MTERNDTENANNSCSYFKCNETMAKAFERVGDTN